MGHVCKMLVRGSHFYGFDNLDNNKFPCNLLLPWTTFVWLDHQPLKLCLDYFQMMHIQRAATGIGKIGLVDRAKTFNAFVNANKDGTKPRVQSRYRIAKLVMISIEQLQ